jgi:type IV fimbrial biogenesis protein FimT
MKKKSGFTLFEMLLTLVIVAVVTAFALPSMRAFSQNDRLTTNINSLIGQLAYARSEAVKRSQQVAVCVSNNSETAAPSCTAGSWEDGWVVYIDEDASNTFDANEIIIKAHAPLTGGNRLTPTNLGTQIIYNNRGFLASNTGSLQLCDTRTGPHGKTITLTATGRVRLETETAC